MVWAGGVRHLRPGYSGMGLFTPRGQSYRGGGDDCSVGIGRRRRCVLHAAAAAKGEGMRSGRNRLGVGWGWGGVGVNGERSDDVAGGVASSQARPGEGLGDPTCVVSTHTASSVRSGPPIRASAAAAAVTEWRAVSGTTCAQPATCIPVSRCALARS
eukprot:scaffold549_cov117-Isochrysis_galbana.AAC.16